MTNTIKKTLAGVAGIAALALGGSALAGAATSNTSTTTPGTSAAPTQQARPNFPVHDTAAHEDAEKPVTGAAATKAKAAAVKSIGSGSTAGEVTTDFTGNGYEVTVTKADGSKTEVHLDSSFTVMKGGPGGHHGVGPGAH